MKNFIKLIKQVHEENYPAFTKRMVEKKIPVAFLHRSPITSAVATVKSFREKGWNITNLITTDSTPPRQP